MPAAPAQPGSGRRPRSPRGQGEHLRADILAAAVRLLEETGTEEGVSIRAVAQAVGVTAPSIYRHFADKQALLDAVCEVVFDALLTAMDDAAAVVADPFQGLFLRGLAYCRWATAHPEPYRLVMRERDDPDGTVAAVAHGCFTRFVEAVQACGPVFADADPEQVALQLWSAAHGVVTLRASTPGFPWAADDDVAFGAALLVAGSGAGMVSRGVEAFDAAGMAAVLDALPSRSGTVPQTVRSLSSLGDASG